MSILKSGQRQFLKNHTWIQLQTQCGNMNVNTARTTTVRTTPPKTTPTPKNTNIKYPPSVPPPTPLSLSLPQVPVEWYKENNYRYIDVGITDRGIDDIGDVTGVKPCFTGMHMHTHSHSHSSRCTETNEDENENENEIENENENINKNIPVWKLKQEEDVLEIQWDAHLITSADELYHTVWETVSETSMIRAPFKGVFVFPHFEIDIQKGRTGRRRRGYVLDSDVPLFTMLVDQDCLDAARTGGRLMDYDAYMEFVETLERGKFHEDDII